MSISWGAQYPKLKTNLRLVINRLKMMGKKKTEMALKARTEIADFISAHKDDRARIRVEHIIREDYMVEAYEILEMYCDLLLARFGLIEQMKELDDGIAEAVISILWAAPRIACDIAEFKTISDQLTVKYGKPFAEAARNNQLEYPAKVNPKLMQKLGVTAPPKILVERYLILIAESAGLPFIPDPDVMREDEVAQAERMLIDFKNALPPPTGQAAPEGGYGWNVPPGAGGAPPPVSQPPNPLPPPGPGAFPGSGSGGSGGMAGGALPANAFSTPTPAPPPAVDNFYDDDDGHIYEVPSNPPGNAHLYDHVPDYYSTPTPNSNVHAPTGQFSLPKIGKNGLPMDPSNEGPAYPALSQRNSLIQDNKSKNIAGPSAPPASIVPPKDDPESELSFPTAPSYLPRGGPGNGGNNGGSGGGGGGSTEFDFYDLARRFNELKNKS